MAIFRVEKTKDYTVMANHHLRNENLSLKSKGLLSQMLSLPDNWDYTLKGLSMLNQEREAHMALASIAALGSRHSLLIAVELERYEGFASELERHYSTRDDK